MNRPVRVVTDFPRAVRTIQTAWIELADGSRLAARIWLPEDAEQDPVPAILEYLPYRLNDGTALRDSRHFPYLAGHGLRRDGSTSAAPASPTASSRTSTCRRSSQTRAR